ncbi:uncharacterized protein LOC106674311 [Cimex lectularius]|uniref:Uncharacterized protein n=1 Tax=Cimex lectularius TaxID=79782 RepID=A0A8I6TLK8_CIMLE|nr:uncharacterized protein LOC106674311 [Cimex lectularius]
MEQQRKHLYLLEVVVKRVTIYPKVLLQSFSFDPAQITELPILVKVNFSSFFNVEIDKDGKLGHCKVKLPKDKRPPTPADVESDNEEASGKSCIFPLSSEYMEKEIRETPMYLNCFTKTEGNMSPILLGRTKINLGSSFLETVCRGRLPAFLPASLTVDTTEKLTNIFGEESGSADISIRLSCFGNALLSDFRSLSPMMNTEFVNKEQFTKQVKGNCNILKERIFPCLC